MDSLLSFYKKGMLDFGRSVVQTNNATSMVFIPYFYSHKSNLFYGISKSTRTSNNHLEICTKNGFRNNWVILEKKHPILPYNHPDRMELERMMKIYM